MFEKVSDPDLLRGEHSVLKFWTERKVSDRLRKKVRGATDENGRPKRFSFLDGPMTANNPMGVHHAWGRSYKDAFQRYFAMTGHELRWQNGFDCQGLWVEVEVEKQLNLGSKTAIAEYGVDKFVWECKRRVLNFAARQTEQSVRLGYWMDWDDPDGLRSLGEKMGSGDAVEYTTPSGKTVNDTAENITAKLGHEGFGGSYFTFSTDNNETIWKFLKTAHERGKVYRGHDVMPWSGRGGSAYSQMEVADGRKLTTHRALFVRFPLTEPVSEGLGEGNEESLLVWTTTPWTLSSNVAAAVNPELEYVCIELAKDTAFGTAGDRIWFAKDNLHFKRGEKEFKEGFAPYGDWPEDAPKLKSLHQIFKEQGGYEEVATLPGRSLIAHEYSGPFDDLDSQTTPGDIDLGDAAVSFSHDALVFQVMNQDDRSLAALEKTRGCLPTETLSRVRDFGVEFGGVDSVDELAEVVVIAVINRLGEELEAASAWATPIPPRQFSGDDVLSQARGVVSDDGVSFMDSLASLYADFGDISITACRLIADDPKRIPSIKRDNCKSIMDCLVAEFLLRFNDFASGILRRAEGSPASNHRVVNGGRDSRGNPLVVAGEGTGIVHAAPGCGDVDHQWGEKYGLPVIAPLKEDGSFGDGFGPFTGREASDPETVDLVIESLKEKKLLVTAEAYPHIYPHCWRTGDELVFRLVDEWFINMDWRDEIKEVVDTIDWLPPAINGREREKEWLTIMRDWMISKKRFWGLALPIWRDEQTGHFEVFGSVAELKAFYDANGGEGWEKFEGHTPHKPWIDFVKLTNPESGNLMTRVEDVGNPWLDAGITPFSTMGYNENREEWEKWFPADLVLECFPGQFRNWFYSLLSLSTMMRGPKSDDPQTDPAMKRPFKTLFGHRLVMNEHGEAMHKSDGTAIWFEEAAEQLGVDALRWMYLAQNPAADLRFGLRHPDEPVTLETPDGPITETKEGATTCKVTSTPVDEVRRQVLIPLWNSYAFFVNYARLDGFDPAWDRLPAAGRPEIDRWLLSNLQSVVTECRDGFEAFDTQRVTAALAAFISDLSGWYIRRNRRRFWDKTGGSADAAGFGDDKLAAYQTLYETLLTLTKLLAPCVPFLSERMYANLVGTSLVGGEAGEGTPDSVHLCDYPEADASLLDAELNTAMAAAQRAVALGHRLREEAGHRVRQPLAELRFATTDAGERAAVSKLAGVIGEELNVRSVTAADDLDDLVSYTFKPNLKTLGPKYGKRLGVIRKELPEADAAALAPLRAGESVTVELSDGPIDLGPDDVLVSTQQSSDWASGNDVTLQLALSTELTDELLREGYARDVIRMIQQARKDAGLEIEDRVAVTLSGVGGDLATAVEEHGETIRGETLAESLDVAADLNGEAAGKIAGADVAVAVIRSA